MRIRTIAAATALVIVGLLAAAAIAPRANAHDINSLPVGFTVTHTVDSSATSCAEYYVIQGYGATSGHLCTDSATFQHDLDAFIDLNCPTTVCAPATTSTASTDASTTDTTSTTTTTTAASAPAAAPAVSAPATSSPSTSVDTSSTQTVTVTTDDPTLAARVATLEQEYETLASRVDAIEQANAAAWQTFHDDIAAGLDTAAAALDARSAALNAIYVLT